jgi:hypothetical protein
MTLLDLSPADFRRFLTVLVDRRLLGSQCCLSTGLVANGIRLTKRYNTLSSRSDVTRGVPVSYSKPSAGMFTIYSKQSPSEYLLYDSKPSPRILYYIVNIPPGENLLYSKHSPIHNRSSPRIFCYIVNVPP